MSTIVEFRARFPQLASVPDPIVQIAIDDSMALWNPALPNWGAVVCYQAAHQITVQSMAMAIEAEMVRSGQVEGDGGSRFKQSGSMVSNLNSTQYGKELIRITLPYEGGGFGLV